MEKVRTMRALLMGAILATAFGSSAYALSPAVPAQAGGVAARGGNPSVDSKKGALMLGDDLDELILLQKRVKESLELQRDIQKLKNPFPDFPLPMPGAQGPGGMQMPPGMMQPPPPVAAPASAPRQETVAPATSLPRILSVSGRKGEQVAVLRFSETGGTMTVRQGDVLPDGKTRVVEISSSRVVVADKGGPNNLMFDPEVTTVPATPATSSAMGAMGMPPSMPPVMPQMMGAPQ